MKEKMIITSSESSVASGEISTRGEKSAENKKEKNVVVEEGLEAEEVSNQREDHSIYGFKEGDEVMIKVRGNDKMEGGWKFISYNKENNKVLIGQFIGGNIEAKNISLRDLIEWNKTRRRRK